jgi:cytochrome c-type biogenesis protein CcmH/NrfG
VLEMAGHACMSMGNPAEAEQAWRKLIEVQPDNLGAYAALGQVYYS